MRDESAVDKILRLRDMELGLTWSDSARAAAAASRGGSSKSSTKKKAAGTVDRAEEILKEIASDKAKKGPGPSNADKDKLVSDILSSGDKARAKNKAEDAASEARDVASDKAKPKKRWVRDFLRGK